MLSDTLQNRESLPGLASHPVWNAAFQWIEEHAADAGDGAYDLGVGGAVVRVMEYDTKPPEQARFEGHRTMVDLQYTIEGAEGIEIAPSDRLTPDGDYDADKDVQFFHAPSLPEARVENVEGRFCILFPHDAHRPQLRVGAIPKVRKLVVKIPLSSL